MKLINILPLVALSAAFVVPEETEVGQQTFSPKKTSKTFFERISSSFGNRYQKSISLTENALDEAISVAESVAKKAKGYSLSTYEAFDAEAWIDSASDETILVTLATHTAHIVRMAQIILITQIAQSTQITQIIQTTQTIQTIQIIQTTQTTQTTRLIHLTHPIHPTLLAPLTLLTIRSRIMATASRTFDDLVQLLNSTEANYTIFAPTDDAFKNAFKHLPGSHKKPSKEIIKAILEYHLSPDLYPLRRLLLSHTVPTSLKEDALGGNAQRLRIGLGLRGLNVNFVTHFKAVNIGATNGIIHAIDHILLPPPSILTILSHLPAQFSTLQLALTKTGLASDIAKAHTTGATFFAPDNRGFQLLGPKVLAFLFSSHGEAYLKALLKYHIVANQTLYSDAFYHSKKYIPAGVPLHVDLPTLLEGKSLGIDIAHFGRLINVRINGYTDVAVQDGIARNGVLQIPRHVLIPPKAPGDFEVEVEDKAGDMTVEDFTSRFGDLADESQEEENKARKAAWWEL
ncbi:hypothetical protein VF21_06227 [Pseudogymnoascus sp. 05NY08]|nr:hypothetical protein VF21_06227 [Pseudogymnoascus sp. 05NY08]